MYCATTGTFLKRDPIGYSSGAAVGYSHTSVTALINERRANPNLYEYVGSSPENYTDPMGLQRWWGQYIKQPLRGIWEVGFFNAIDVATALADEARTFAKKYAKGDERIQNALRHCYWQAMLTFIHGAKAAQAIGNAHEYGEEDTEDSRTDQFNNAVGRYLGGLVADSLRKSYDAKTWWEPCPKSVRKKAGEIAGSLCVNAAADGDLIMSIDDPRIGDAKGSGK